MLSTVFFCGYLNTGPDKCRLELAIGKTKESFGHAIFSYLVTSASSMSTCLIEMCVTRTGRVENRAGTAFFLHDHHPIKTVRVWTAVP